MVNANDMNELKRMLTNLYDEEKACIFRVLRGIGDLHAENLRLKAEVQKLSVMLTEDNNSKENND